MRSALRLMQDALCIVPGAGHVVRNACCALRGAWCVVRGTGCVVRCAWCVVRGTLCTALGSCGVVRGAVVSRLSCTTQMFCLGSTQIKFVSCIAIVIQSKQTYISVLSVLRKCKKEVDLNRWVTLLLLH